ncbi:MAG: GatB/YqeY domain-containing protein [Deltaproteobacteria bacterium]|nr:GatB/YqeY domain-containing protein [Deltaproteobacteria bacterium]
MALRDTVDTDMKAAMKAQDKPRLDAIRLIKNEIRKKEIDEKITLDDAGVLGVLAKLAKQRQDSIDQYKAGGRQDLVDKESAELALIQAYMPKQMGEDEVKALVAEAVKETGAAGGKDMGKVMGVLMPKVKGKADGKLVSALVKAALGG